MRHYWTDEPLNKEKTTNKKVLLHEDKDCAVGMEKKANYWTRTFLFTPHANNHRNKLMFWGPCSSDAFEITAKQLSKVYHAEKTLFWKIQMKEYKILSYAVIL